MKTTLCFLLLMLAMGSYAQDDDGEFSEPELLPSRLEGKVTDITIKGVRKNAAPEAKGYPDCGSFALSLSEVHEFFDKAAEISHSDNHYRMNWSPCYVHGKLTLKNGETLPWVIDQLRGGSIVVNGNELIYFYCPRCRGKTFLSQ